MDFDASLGVVTMALVALSTVVGCIYRVMRWRNDDRARMAQYQQAHEQRVAELDQEYAWRRAELDRLEGERRVAKDPFDTVDAEALRALSGNNSNQIALGQRYSFIEAAAHFKEYIDKYTAQVAPGLLQTFDFTSRTLQHVWANVLQGSDAASAAFIARCISFANDGYLVVHLCYDQDRDMGYATNKLGNIVLVMDNGDLIAQAPRPAGRGARWKYLAWRVPIRPADSPEDWAPPDSSLPTREIRTPKAR